MSDTMDSMVTDMDQQELAQQFLAQARDRALTSSVRAGC
jgi:hypothetical protein